jgi:heme/copper-type cytochrome/quinol oxidase subunit 1
MTITETRPQVEVPAAAAPVPVLADPAGLHGWLTTGDHKRVGRLYVGAGFIVLLGMLVIGALLAFERIDDSGAAILHNDAIAQLFSLYGVGLVFGAVLPMVLGVAIAVVPLQVGARSIAFPRAAAFSFWVWLTSTGVMIGAYIGNGGPGGGDAKMVDLFLAALAAMVIALLIGSMCVAATVLALRAPGMTLLRVPFLAWSAMVTASMLLLSLAVLVGDLIFLYVDNRYGRTAFGGNTKVGSYLTWSLRAPQVYLYALPALGIIADVVATSARRRHIQRTLLFVLFAFGAVLGFGAFAQDGLYSGITTKFIYIAIVLLSVIPVLAVLVVCGLQLAGGRPRLSAPLVLVLLTGLLAIFGVVAGALWPISGLDLAGTVYTQGYVNVVMFGAVLGVLAAITYWGPKLTGRRLADSAAQILGVLVLVAALAVTIPDIVLGFLGQPANVVNDLHTSGSAFWNAVSAVGYALLFLFLLAFVLVHLQSLRRGDAAGDDPWDGVTLEWATTSPPPPGNFVEVPLVRSGEPLLDQKEA